MLYSESIGKSISVLFADMSIVSLFVMTVGMMLVIIEFFQSTKKIAGVTGAVMIAVGMVIRMLYGGTPGIMFFMIFFVVIILFAAHILMLVTQKKDWLLKSLDLAVNDKEYIARTTDGYNHLKNLTGIATTDIDETGHISINDVNFFVNSAEFIRKGSTVRVIEADSEKIVVESLGDEYYIPVSKSRDTETIE